MTVQDVTLSSITSAFNVDSNGIVTSLKSGYSPGSFSVQYYKKAADQVIAGPGTVTFSSTPDWTVGSSIGSMAASGVFTFSVTGVYEIVFAFNVSASPDGWGVFSGDTTRYIQHTTILKGSVSQYLRVTAVSQTFNITENSGVTVFGTGGTASALSITRVA